MSLDELHPTDGGTDAAQEARPAGELAANEQAAAGPDDPATTRRGIVELHRDMWRIVRSAPSVFILVPAVAWLPIDWMLEFYVQSTEKTVWQQTLLSLRLQALGGLTVGILVRSIHLAALVELGAGRTPTLKSAIYGGLRLWSRMFGAYLAIMLRVTLGVFLLIVPGVYLMMRYALVLPVVAFDGATGATARKESARLMRGNYGRLALVFSVGALVYGPIQMAPIMILPGASGPGWTALAAVLMNVVVSWLVIAWTLIYADGRRHLTPPVGPVPPGSLPETTAPRGWRGVLTAAAVSLVVFGASVAVSDMPFNRALEEAEQAWERGEYEVALSAYRRAAYWDPEDAYTHYSIGWCLYVLDRLLEADVEFVRALELEPDNLGYRLDRARVLIELDRTREARAELENVRRGGYENTEALEELMALVDSADENAN